MDNQFEPLDSGEVLSVDESAQILIAHRTFRVEELVAAIKKQLQSTSGKWTSEKDAWLSTDGIPCEVLKFNARGWQKGQVRINLEFCPQESEAQVGKASTQVDAQVAISGAADTEDEEDDLELGESDTSTEDELDIGTSSAFIDDELDLDSSISMELEDDEFELGTAASDELLDPEPPADLYRELEEEAATFDDDDDDDVLGFTDASSSLDDEFDEISQSIEEELEMTEEPLTSEDELLDLGEISVDSDDDLNFGDFSTNDELDDEDDDHDSLLDDVWQDINQSN